MNDSLSTGEKLVLNMCFPQFLVSTVVLLPQDMRDCYNRVYCGVLATIGLSRSLRPYKQYSLLCFGILTIQF